MRDQPPAAADGLNEDRTLQVEGCYNFRDAGGWPLADGRRMRTGVLYRSDDSTRLTPAGKAAVEALGLSTIVDLRQPIQYDRGFFFVESRTFHCALVDRVLDVDNPPPLSEPEHMTDMYIGMLAKSVEPMSRALENIAAHIGEGPVLVNCVYGKDRTGLLVAVLMAAIGASPEVISAEYARSNTPTNDRFDVMAADPIPGDGPVARAPRFLFTATYRTMEALMEHLLAEYGSLDAWIASFPVRPGTWDAIRAALIEG